MSVEQQITSKVTASFQPHYLQVINESYQHNVPADSETHFKLVLVSDAFDELSLVKRHQAVYSALSQELADGVHALALHLFTQSEWGDRNQSVSDSPRCLSGSSAR